MGHHQMNNLQQFLHSFHDDGQAILDEYTSHWTEFSAPRKSILTHPDQVERYVYFVKEGSQRSYYVSNAKEHVMFFAYPPSFSGVMESFLTQSPSRYFLETISDSHFLRLPYDTHLRLIQQFRPLETLFRKVTEHLLSGVIERQHELLTFDAKTRLSLFLQRSPHLLNSIPHHHLASYLRINPSNFSKFINQNKF